MLASLLDCTIIEQCAIQFLWSEVVKHSRFTEECQHNAEKTVSCKGKSANEGKGSKVAEQALLMKTTWTIWSLHEWQAILELNRLLSLIHPTSWTSAVDLHIPSSMRTLGTTKSVQGGCQSCLQMSIRGHVRKYACNSCSDIVKKKRLSHNGLSQAMKHGCVHHCEPASKCQSIEWKHMSSPRTKK